MGVGPVTRRNGDDNAHTVTVTVVSTACDGSTEQRASGTVIFPEQPPPPPIGSVPGAVVPRRAGGTGHPQ
jgi:hypothetical protein